MRLKEAIDRADEMKPNQYSEEIKLRWLQELDYSIYHNFIEKHEDDPYFTEVLYEETEDETEEPQQILVNEKGQKYLELPHKDAEAETLASFPYDTLYVYYLLAKIDEANGETDLYVNSMALYNNAYNAYTKAYNREHRHL